jgi:hypothetical protein
VDGGQVLDAERDAEWLDGGGHQKSDEREQKEEPPMPRFVLHVFGGIDVALIRRVGSFRFDSRPERRAEEGENPDATREESAGERGPESVAICLRGEQRQEPSEGDPEGRSSRDESLRQAVPPRREGDRRPHRASHQQAPGAGSEKGAA